MRIKADENKKGRSRWAMAGRPSAEESALLRRTAEGDPDVAKAAMREVAMGLLLPLRQGVIHGPILDDIFEPQWFEPGTSTEYPLDFLSPGTEKEYVAFTIPSTGAVPHKTISGDYLMVPTYETGAAIDWPLRYARDARWDIVGRAMQVLEGMFVRKLNDDGWHVLLAGAKARNFIVQDDLAGTGLFTKRLVAAGETSMQRNGGGNTASRNRGVLTDLYMSPEAHQDVLSWDLTQVPDAVRTQIYLNWSNGGVAKIGKVSLHDLIELGVGQLYQQYYASALGGSMPAGKEELLVGLDLTNRDSFVMPMRQDVELWEDMMLHRQRRAGLYGSQESGFAMLDARRGLLLAI